MALYVSFPLLPFSKKPSLLSSSSSQCLLSHRRLLADFHPICCLSTANAVSSTPARRTANYQPTIWDDNYIQSLPIDFMEEKYIHRRDILKEQVRGLIGKQHDLIEQLELVDALCQLGLQYHFDSEIKDLLSSISSSTVNINNLIENGNLHGSALLFRLLREYDIKNASLLRVEALINCFKSERGNFNPNHQHNVKGLLSFYEASYLAMEGEEQLDEAGKIAMERLRNLDISLLSPQIIEEINHAFELPLHWRMSRLHARWFIDVYGTRENVNPTLLELATLDFNIVQSIYKAELQEMSRWWKNLGLVCDELNFARDRLVENYLMALGFTFQPEFWRIRKAITKLNSFVTTIDDIYDVYGTLDELKLFTNAVEEWKIDAGQQLPNYMKKCLDALFNTMNDIATSFSVEKELDILPCLKRVWADLCKAYLVEARWYQSGYTPTLNEYLENAWVTISGTCILIIAYCLSDDLTSEALNKLEFYPSVARHSSMLFRLYDDLGTSTAEIQRGDVSKSIQCYMREKNVSEPFARDHIRYLIRNYWKKLNQECTTFSIPIKSFRKALVDVPRTGQFFYHYGDGYGESYGQTKDQIISILIEPISL
ncbi:terpene synthase 10-like [Phalaenopsis equestris]|uniref:terpene synthase 10-like n=1 Tax=Phalaenopsis equestris TaxID=78828 RepID=UPI0009E1FAB8|nr:terpene synthase 10-like [Phalaenopsis equestris]